MMEKLPVTHTVFSFKFQVLLILLLGLYCGQITWAQSGTLVATFEAENGVLSGGVLKGNSIAGYTGSGYVTNFKNSGDKVTVTVNVPSKGFYSISIRYHSDYKKQYVYVNGGGASEVEFVSTGSSWGTADAGKYILNAGDNTITVQNGWGWVEVDQFKVYTTVLNTYNNITPNVVDSNANVGTVSLYNFLYSQFGKRIISGQTDGFYDSIKHVTGKSPMYRAWDFMHYTEGYPYLWKNGGFAFGVDLGEKSTDNAIVWYNSTGKKGIVGFHWHWCSPSGGTVGTNTFSTANTTFDITKAVQKGTSEYTLAIRDIDAIAAQLKKLQTAGIPVLFRPMHEAGGGWFWWGAKGSTACKQLYEILFDRITNYHQLHNIIWVWSTYETDWYPGNDKVDIVGMDSYPGDYNYSTQKNTFDRYYNLIGGKKIITMSENGPIPDPDDCLDLDAPWSYFMSWNDLVFSQNETSHIKAVYSNPRVLTLENDTFPIVNDATNGSVCNSGNVTLSGTANFGTIKWYTDSIGGDTLHTGNSFITPHLSTTTKYYIEASYNGKPSDMKRTAVTAKIFVPVDTLNIIGNDQLCQGTSNVVYNVNSNKNIDSYTWKLPSGAIGTSTTNSISVNFSNSAVSGNITVKGHNECGDGPERIFAVIVNSIPAKPVISLDSGILKSNEPLGNQWFFSDNLIPSAIGNTFTPAQKGDYYAIVTLNGCKSDFSNILSFIPTGVRDIEGNTGIGIFPNPTSGNVRVLANNYFDSDYIVEVYNNIGELQYSIKKDKSENQFDMDLTKLSNGIYLLRIYSSNKCYESKVIKW